MSKSQKFIEAILLIWQLEYSVNDQDPFFWSKKLLTALRLDLDFWLKLDLSIQTAALVQKYERSSF